MCSLCYSDKVADRGTDNTDKVKNKDGRGKRGLYFNPFLVDGITPFYNRGWDSGYNTMVGNVFNYYSICSYDNIVANYNSTNDFCSTANGNIVAYCWGIITFITNCYLLVYFTIIANAIVVYDGGKAMLY